MLDRFAVAKPIVLYCQGIRSNFGKPTRKNRAVAATIYNRHCPWAMPKFYAMVLTSDTLAPHMKGAIRPMRVAPVMDLGLIIFYLGFFQLFCANAGGEAIIYFAMRGFKRKREKVTG